MIEPNAEIATQRLSIFAKEAAKTKIQKTLTLYFDTETSGLPPRNYPLDDLRQPWVVQLAAVLSTNERVWGSLNLVIQAKDREIERDATRIHGYDKEITDFVGVEESAALWPFLCMLDSAKLLVAHNITFDVDRLSVVLLRHLPRLYPVLQRIPKFCTMEKGTDFCKIPGKFGKYKWPKLSELYQHLFGEVFENQHDALADVMATRRCHLEMVRLSEIKDNLKAQGQ